MSTGMEEFIESPMLLLQCGVAIAVPAVLTAIVNLGCGKKRDPPIRPGGAKKDLSKTKPGVASSTKSAKSGKSKRSTKSAASTKSGKKKVGSTKEGKSKRSAKSIDKSGKSGKKSKKSSKGSKSSKSKKSKREVKQQKTGPPSSQRSDAATKQPASVRTAIEAETRSAKQAATHAAAAIANEAKSAATQLSSSQRSQQQQQQQPACGVIVDANANAIGTTSLIALGAGDPTRELKMEPAELRWSSAGGMQKITLLNQSGERQAVKVKCSDNNVYRVNPVYAIVEPGQTLNVDVMRQNGSNKVDKIVFVTTRAGLEENPKNLFKPGTQSSMMVLPLLASTTAASAINQPALAAAN